MVRKLQFVRKICLYYCYPVAEARHVHRVVKFHVVTVALSW